MKRFSKIFLVLAITLILGAFAVLHFGSAHAHNQWYQQQEGEFIESPPFLGIEWFFRSIIIFILGLLSGFSSLVCWLIYRFKTRKNQAHGA